MILRLRQILFTGILIVVLAGCGFSAGADPGEVAAGTPYFDETKLDTVEKNVVYCTAEDGTPLLLDIYYPKVDSGPWPVMLHVHGGGWSSGSKDEGSLFPGFTDLGLVGVEIGYRLSPGVQFPAHIEDVKCAVRYLRANAEQLHIDPDRFLAVGGSAGGHLVSLLGTTGQSGEFNVGEHLEVSSAVQSVIAMSAPVNLSDMLCWRDGVANLALYAFGSEAKCGEIDPILEAASPIQYINADTVPFLLLAGTADEVVPYQQSVEMDAALKAAGIDSTLILVDGGDHALNVQDDPAQGEWVLQEMITFTLTQLELERPEWLEE